MDSICLDLNLVSFPLLANGLSQAKSPDFSVLQCPSIKQSYLTDFWKSNEQVLHGAYSNGWHIVDALVTTARSVQCHKTKCLTNNEHCLQGAVHCWFAHEVHSPSIVPEQTSSQFSKDFPFFLCYPSFLSFQITQLLLLTRTLELA